MSCSTALPPKLIDGHVIVHHALLIIRKMETCTNQRNDNTLNQVVSYNIDAFWLQKIVDDNVVPMQSITCEPASPFMGISRFCIPLNGYFLLSICLLLDILTS